MAILKSVLGTLNQSMGGVTFSKWKDKNVAKQKVPSNNTSNTELQSTQRSKFGALAKFAALLGPAIRVGFKTLATDKTEQNVFTSRNFGTLLGNGGGGWFPDIKALQVAAGNVLNVNVTTAKINPVSHIVEVSWTDNTNGGSAYSDDVICIALMEASGNGAIFSLGEFARTEEFIGSKLHVPPGAKPGDYCLYYFMKRKNGTATSPSTYIGVSV